MLAPVLICQNGVQQSKCQVCHRRSSVTIIVSTSHCSQQKIWEKRFKLCPPAGWQIIELNICNNYTVYLLSIVNHSRECKTIFKFILIISSYSLLLAILEQKNRCLKSFSDYVRHNHISNVMSGFLAVTTFVLISVLYTMDYFENYFKNAMKMSDKIYCIACFAGIVCLIC